MNCIVCGKELGILDNVMYKGKCWFCYNFRSSFTPLQSANQTADKVKKDT